MADANATNRFSNRVLHYARSRPSYPPAFYAFLKRELNVTPASVIADVGSGTGISARPLLEEGARVFGLEPNVAMRAAAEQLLAAFPNFVSRGTSAEDTALPTGSVDLVLAAQAFHWFDKAKARAEFARILKPGGQVVLVWNERRLDSTPFLRDYEQLLQTYGTDYNQIRHENVDAAVLAAFFAPATYQTRQFLNAQHFDYAGLESRLLSSSYTPAPDHPSHGPMLRALREIFDRHEMGGLVSFDYDSRAHYGGLSV